jgi:hypothetical protein
MPKPRKQSAAKPILPIGNGPSALASLKKHLGAAKPPKRPKSK